jgi:hypothetical protein
MGFLGAFVSPLICSLFLNDSSSIVYIREDNLSTNTTEFTNNNTLYNNSNFIMIRFSNSSLLSIQDTNGVNITYQLDESESALYSYVVVAAFNIPVAICFLLLAVYSKSSTLPHVDISDKTLVFLGSKAEMICFYCVAYVFFFCQSAFEACLSVMLAPIATTAWGWSDKQAAYLPAVLQFSMAISVVIVIVISTWVLPNVIITIDVIVLVSGSTLMFLYQFVDLPTTTLWIAVIIMGVGASCLMAQGILLINQYVGVTSLTSSIIYFAFICGWITGPFIGTILFDLFSHVAVLLVNLIISFICLLDACAFIYLGRRLRSYIDLSFGSKTIKSSSKLQEID